MTLHSCPTERSEGSAGIAGRVAAARARQRVRYDGVPGVSLNADAEGDLLEAAAETTPEAQGLLEEVARRFHLSARGYHRVMRVARTIADLEGSEPVEKRHVAEAVGYRLAF